MPSTSTAAAPAAATVTYMYDYLKLYIPWQINEQYSKPFNTLLKGLVAKNNPYYNAV